ncbi:hypothetical protein BT96DRAFT_810304, partial [Gymnopus androsaceus JB14]
GGALLYLASLEGAAWLKKGEKLEAWTKTWGVEIRANFELDEVVVQMVPVTEDLDEEHVLRAIEADNCLEKGAIAKARWVKAPERRKDNQKVAFAVFSFNSPEAVNHIL